MKHSRLGGGIVQVKVVWQVEAQWEKRMKGSVPVGNLIPCQAAQVRAGKERKGGWKVDKKNMETTTTNYGWKAGWQVIFESANRAVSS